MEIERLTKEWMQNTGHERYQKCMTRKKFNLENKDLLKVKEEVRQDNIRLEAVSGGLM